MGGEDRRSKAECESKCLLDLRPLDLGCGDWVLIVYVVEGLYFWRSGLGSILFWHIHGLREEAQLTYLQGTAKHF